jgi:hypothetical protein
LQARSCKGKIRPAKIVDAAWVVACDPEDFLIESAGGFPK